MLFLMCFRRGTVSRHSLEENAIRIEGRCHRGKIAYEATAILILVGICLFLPKIPSEPEFESSARIAIELIRFSDGIAI
jgi:hypothetical protein